MSMSSRSAFHTPSGSTSASSLTSTPSSPPVSANETKHHFTEPTSTGAPQTTASSTASSPLPTQHTALTSAAINAGGGLGMGSGWLKFPQASPSSGAGVSGHIGSFSLSGSGPPLTSFLTRATSPATTSQHLIQLAHQYISEGALARALLSAIASVHCFSDLSALNASTTAADGNALAALYESACSMRRACIQLYEEDLKRRAAASGQPFIGWNPDLFMMAKDMAHTNESFYLDLCESLMLSRRPPQQIILSPQTFASAPITAAPITLPYAPVTVATPSIPMTQPHMTSPVSGFVPTAVAYAMAPVQSMPIVGDMYAPSSSEWDTAVCKYCNRAWELPDGRDAVSQKKRNRALKAKRDHVPYCPFNPKREANLSKRRNKKHNKSEARKNEQQQSSASSQPQQTSSSAVLSSSPQQSSEDMSADDGSDNEDNQTSSQPNTEQTT